MLSTKIDSFSQNFLNDLTKYGLDTDEAKIYLYLLENSAKSALTISRESQLARTKVYRILDKLTAKGLVTHEVKSAGLRFLAESPQKLALLLAKQTKSVAQLESQHAHLVSELENLAKEYASAGSEVRYYTGLDGLKQVTQNSLAAKKQLLVFELNQDMSKFIDYDFAEEIRRGLVKQKITTFQLTNLPKVLPYTQVTTLISDYWRVKHVSPKDFKIDFEVLIYNDVYALYTYQHGEAFCVEIHNPYLAKMQRQLFKFVWKRAEPMTILDQYGSAVLTK
jgi:sugar-specific transcriptional regulator TrmB